MRKTVAPVEPTEHNFKMLDNQDGTVSFTMPYAVAELMLKDLEKESLGAILNAEWMVATSPTDKELTRQYRGFIRTRRRIRAYWQDVLAWVQSRAFHAMTPDQQQAQIAATIARLDGPSANQTTTQQR